MTLTEKKKHLENYRIEIKELERFEKEYEGLKKLNRIIGDGSTQTENTAIKDINNEKIRLCRRVSKLIKDKQNIEKKIDGLENGTYALLLRYRYIDGYSWEEITELLDYSWRSVHYMHNKALNDIAM